jgi:hypothetical protein
VKTYIYVCMYVYVCVCGIATMCLNIFPLLYFYELHSVSHIPTCVSCISFDSSICSKHYYSQLPVYALYIQYKTLGPSALGILLRNAHTSFRTHNVLTCLFVGRVLKRLLRNVTFNCVYLANVVIIFVYCAVCFMVLRVCGLFVCSC